MKTLLQKLGAAFLVLTFIYALFLIGDNKANGDNLFILVGGIAVGIGLIILPNILQKK